MAGFSINPILTTNGLGSFSIQSEGFVQGVFFDDPAIRNELDLGVLASTETLPMWGGIPIFENIATPGADVLGNSVGRAANIAAIAGFSTVNQATAWVNSPTSQVPTGQNGMTVPFFRLGSGAQIVVACDPSLSSLIGGSTSPQVSWDFNNQRLQPYDASTPTVSVTSITPTFANGVWTLAVVAAAATVIGAVGDAFNISGATNTGTGGAALVNGNFTVSAFTDNQHFSYQITANSGAIGTIAGTILLNFGTGALPVKVLQFNFGNSKIVQWDPVNQVANWINNGSAALIQI